MTLALACAVAAAFAPVRASAPAAGAQDWVALPIPALCSEPIPRNDPAPLVDGFHLRLPDDEPSSEAHPAPELPLNVVRRLLEDEARESGLEIHPSSALLAVRGSEEAVASAHRALADLDRAGRALRVELSIWHVPEGSPDGASFPAVVSGRAPWRRIELGSGESGMVGARRVRSFVSGYRVEVAHDSGVADPDLGRVVVGRTLHLRPERIAGGARVHVRGLLDVAELTAIESFDPETPDLGQLEQPVVESLQLAFAGTVASGDALRVDVRGRGLASVDGTWWIGVDAASDPTEATWRIADFAFLETPARALPFPSPGVLLDDAGREYASPLGVPLGAFDALQQATLGLGASAFPRVEAVPRLIVGPADDPTWEQLDPLRRAAEGDRARTVDVTVTADELVVRLPASGAGSARVLSARERTLLVDYDVTLAPETWMPVPETARVLDGVCLEALVTSDGILCRGWSSHSDPPETVERASSSLGRYQLPARALAQGQRTIPLESGRSAMDVVAADEPTTAIAVEVASP